MLGEVTAQWMNLLNEEKSMPLRPHITQYIDILMFDFFYETKALRYCQKRLLSATPCGTGLQALGPCAAGLVCACIRVWSTEHSLIGGYCPERELDVP